MPQCIDIVFERGADFIRLDAPMPMPNLRWDSVARILDYDDPVSIYPPSMSDHPLTGTMCFRAVYRAVLTKVVSPAKEWPLPEPFVAALKYARGKPEVERLRREAEFYASKLDKMMERGIVPRCHGFFAGTYNGVPVACMTLDWYGAVPNRSDDDMNRKKMMAICSLHKEGIVHGDLTSDHHFLCASPTGPVVIIDFSTATVHKCQGQIPLLIGGERCLGSGPLSSIPIGCQELYNAEVMFGRRDGVPLSATRKTMFPAMRQLMRSAPHALL